MYNDTITKFNEVDPGLGYTICEFDGLEIKMFLEDVSPDQFLVYGEGTISVYGLDGIFMAGDQPDSKIDGKIKHWCKKNRTKLIRCWFSCWGGHKPGTVPPPALSRRAQKRRARKKLL